MEETQVCSLDCTNIMSYVEKEFIMPKDSEVSGTTRIVFRSGGKSTGNRHDEGWKAHLVDPNAKWTMKMFRKGEKGRYGLENAFLFAVNSIQGIGIEGQTYSYWNAEGEDGVPTYCSSIGEVVRLIQTVLIPHMKAKGRVFVGEGGAWKVEEEKLAEREAKEAEAKRAKEAEAKRAREAEAEAAMAIEAAKAQAAEEAAKRAKLAEEKAQAEAANVKLAKEYEARLAEAEGRVVQAREQGIEQGIEQGMQQASFGDLANDAFLMEIHAQQAQQGLEHTGKWDGAGIGVNSDAENGESHGLGSVDGYSPPAKKAKLI